MVGRLKRDRVSHVVHVHVQERVARSSDEEQ